jgi:hypothetical protein
MFKTPEFYVTCAPVEDNRHYWYFVLKVYAPEGNGLLLHICFSSRITRLLIKNGERDDIL